MIVAVACTAACNQILGLHPPDHLVADASSTVDADFGAVCDPIAYDPRRYDAIQHLSGGSNLGYNVASALDDCELIGMQLVSFDADDSAELANELQAGQAPFWTGASWVAGAWVNPDGCTPYIAFASGLGPNGATGLCVLQTVGGMDIPSCTQNLYNGTVPINALCETPRPSATCRRYMSERDYQIVSKAPVTFDVAAPMCPPGSHVVEIDSSDELETVRNMATAAGISSFWLGAQWLGVEWSSPTNCPQVFAWENGGSRGFQPYEGQNAGYHQAIFELAGMYVGSNGDLASVICETNQ